MDANTVEVYESFFRQNDLMQIRLVRPEEGDILHAFARACFVTAFAHYNTPDDMTLYLEDHLTVKKYGPKYRHGNSTSPTETRAAYLFR